MKNIKAFPRPFSDTGKVGDSPQPVYEQDGMTLRDYFAAKALETVRLDYVNITKSDIEYIAEISYAIADAMIKERER